MPTRWRSIAPPPSPDGPTGSIEEGENPLSEQKTRSAYSFVQFLPCRRQPLPPYGDPNSHRRRGYREGRYMDCPYCHVHNARARCLSCGAVFEAGDAAELARLAYLRNHLARWHDEGLI